jgi:hypothetical protein
MKKTRWIDVRGEQECEYSPGLVASLMDQGIEVEIFEIENLPDEVVLSDKYDRQVCVSRPGTKSFEEKVAKGWYIIEGLSPDNLPWDCDPQL